MTSPAPDRRPLNEYLRVQLRMDVELNRVLELAARQSSSRVRQLKLREGDSIGARVRVAQLSAVLAELADIQQSTWTTGIGPIIRRSYAKAHDAALKSFKAVEDLLAQATGSTGRELIKSFQLQAQRGLELDRLRRARDLSPRVYKNAALSSGAVERQIRSGIIQGLSVRELADSVKKYISPSTPGGVAYAAKRLARTEINNAFHEAQKIEGEAPWVRGVQWNLSNSHPAKRGTGKPDKCDIYAKADPFDLGRGVYPADQVPDKPHPQCLCYMTHQTVSDEEMLDLIVAQATGRSIA